MKLPKVLIFTPIYEGKDYCLDVFVEAASKLSYPNYEHIFVDNSATEDYANKLRSKGLTCYYVGRGASTRESLARAQNKARLLFLEGDYDYLMSLESDIMVIPHTIEVLLSHGQRVVTALYFIGNTQQKVKFPCITLPQYIEGMKAFGTRLLNIDEIPSYLNAGLKQVQAGGLGCCLIERSIMEDHVFYYDARFMGHSDIYFFNELFEERIPVWVDTDLILEHDSSDWLEVENR